MLIKKITTIKELEALKTNWIDVYRKDHNATVFSSWEWTLGWLKSAVGNWFILAVYSNAGNYISFALLRATNSSLRAGTFPVSDHNCYICLPEHKTEADIAINKYISKNIRWPKYELMDIFDNHFDKSIKYWSSYKYKITHLQDTPCPYIELPDSWEIYLGSMNKNTRRNILISLTRTKELKSFNMTQISEDTYENDINTVFTLWQNKWGEKNNNLINSMRSIFRECFLNNKLRVIIFWVGRTPIAANLGFSDPEKRSFYTYIGGFDLNYKETSPGTAIVADEIKYAISNGYKCFDFLRGDERYKYMTFKAKDRFNKNCIIENRMRLGLRNVKKIIKIINPQG